MGYKGNLKGQKGATGGLEKGAGGAAKAVKTVKQAVAKGKKAAAAAKKAAAGKPEPKMVTKTKPLSPAAKAKLEKLKGAAAGKKAVTKAKPARKGKAEGEESDGQTLTEGEDDVGLLSTEDEDKEPITEDQEEAGLALPDYVEKDGTVNESAFTVSLLASMGKGKARPIAAHAPLIESAVPEQGLTGPGLVQAMVASRRGAQHPYSAQTLAESVQSQSVLRDFAAKVPGMRNLSPSDYGVLYSPTITEAELRQTAKDHGFARTNSNRMVHPNLPSMSLVFLRDRMLVAPTPA
jgi:hypothetical protein